MVTSVECGRAVDVSSDEGGLLFPHSVVPHPPDTTLYTGEKKREGRRGKMRQRWCGRTQMRSVMKERGNKGKEQEQVMEGKYDDKSGKENGKKHNMSGYDVQKKGKLVQERH